MEYNHKEIEGKWQEYWKNEGVYKVEVDKSKPKYYVLDMFPYPSGAGLHVGHPLGYIASDIYARYKRQKGFNVLHPMGYDAYGLPAEQYAIQTGQHPAITTEENLKRYREQLDKIGFSFDWSREVKTCDSQYYKWTQWTFIQLFNSWYNKQDEKADKIENLKKIFEAEGNLKVQAANAEVDKFDAASWNGMPEKEQQEVLMNYRLAYLSDTWVNWCPELGTVLANDEVKDGVSERGGHPVERKLMKQWSLRITAYAQRLLDGLDKIDWSDSIKEVQRNWIGRSEGASVNFKLKDSEEIIEVFTTRPDTIFGATFMVLAPEHELVDKITTKEHRTDIEKYVIEAKNRSERERQAEVKNITGQFTGSYAINPLNGEEIPVWIADYVLMGYGTGAIMAVPAHDSRDFAFAKYFDIPIIQVVSREGETPSDPSTWEESYDSKEGKMINSDFITGMDVKDAIRATIERIGDMNIGYGTINYRLRDAIFSRQRYWGEPFPMYYKDGMPYPLSEDKLPLQLPEVDKYLPTAEGEPPLARAKDWKTNEGYQLEFNTMPGFAGSSGYYLRYMDPQNNEQYFSEEANAYWRNVDLYIGGTEHATGHLIYARFWNKFLYDIGLACEEEPFKKLINQGMIQGRSNFVYRVNMEKYAEYLLWGFIREQGMDKEFERNYRDGHRKFDFYNKKENLIIEIKSREKLEKLESYYEEYIKDTGKKLLLIPIADIISMDQTLADEAQKAIAESEEGVIFNHREIRELKPMFVSKDVKDYQRFSTPLHVDINIVDNDVLDVEAFKQWRPEFKEAEFILKDGKYVCGHEVEKMSKSKHNVQNPDDLIEKYGADTFRLYEMFLGPVEQHKPWDTKGIEGVNRFLKKLWRLYHNGGELNIIEAEPTKEELKSLHKVIKKTAEDVERFSLNTAVSAFMVCVNELIDLKCNKKDILESLAVVVSSFAPHIAEELWHKLGNETSVVDMEYPAYNEEYLKEDAVTYPVSFNGKMRFKIELPADMPKNEVEATVLADERSQKWIEGKTPKKIIVVPGRIVNIVV